MSPTILGTSDTPNIDGGPSPFPKGLAIEALFTAEHNATKTSVILTIENTFEPVTMSVVSVVSPRSIAPPSSSALPCMLPSLMVLKLFDRRFATSLRAARRAAKWDPEIEVALKQFYHQPHQPAISVERPTDSWNRKPGPDSWTVGYREAYLEARCKSFLNTELSAYRRLLAFQGSTVPWLYGTVTCDIFGMKVEGILLEFLGPTAFTLQHIPDNMAPGLLQEIGDIAVQAITDIGDSGVVSSDMRLDNAMVVPPKAQGGSPRVVMIDLAQARLRRPEEDDEHWRKCRLSCDVEAGFGYALEMRSRGAFKYEQLNEHESDYDDPAECSASSLF